MYNNRMSTISTTDARAALPELLDRVASGDEVTITRHGRPVAVLVRPETLRTRRADEVLAAASALQDRLASSRAGSTRPGEHPGGGITPERADELVADIRSSRDAEVSTASR